MTGAVRRWLRPWLGPLREWRALRRRRQTITLDIPGGGGRIETCAAGPDGIVSVAGWSDDLDAYRRSLRLVIDGTTQPPSHVFRVPRPEMERHSRGGFRGAVAEWVIDGAERSRPAALLLDGTTVHTFAVPARPPVPYGHLHLHPEILGRDAIYGSGMPVHVVSEETLHLARQLPAPILDFGCGGGALVRALRREGLEAYGLEIDDERIRTHLLSEARPYVTLYNGDLPAPFGNGQFASITCSEVLEHLPNPLGAIAEMGRVATTALLVTVPDASGIPRGYPCGVVPWHLLESTHVNFFTQYSLTSALASVADSIEVSRIGGIQEGGLYFYTCLAAVAQLRKSTAEPIG